MAKIDYIGLSFSIQRLPGEGTIKRALARHGLAGLGGLVPVELRTLAKPRPTGRRPFSEGLLYPSGVTVLWNADILLLEISGNGCSQFDPRQWAATFPKTIFLHDNIARIDFIRVTRLDLCHDIDTDTSPFDAVTAWGISKRIKARSVQSSASGQTFYVGSRTSAQFMRVYRYAEPHPRANWLRMEAQYNKDVAGDALTACIEGSVNAVLTGTLKRTFTTPPVVGADEGLPVSPPRGERGNASTLRWIYAQCVPAIKRLIADGELSLDDLVEAIEGS